jgi:hypothetical protein
MAVSFRAEILKLPQDKRVKSQGIRPLPENKSFSRSEA